MAIAPFLAMTAAEMGNAADFPKKSAWMACHFSPYGLGLSNLPQDLPPHALIVLDDITPIRGHLPEIITQQLLTCTEGSSCRGVLLDFQRELCPETAELAKHLVSTLPCPVIVSAGYAKAFPCPVFLPPVPPSMPLQEYLSPWKDREIWLEIGLEGETLTLTERGCEIAPLPYADFGPEGFAEEALHCHYRIETNKTSVRFTLWRTKEDLAALLEEAERLGVTGAVGLYQQLQGFVCKGSG